MKVHIPTHICGVDQHYGKCPVCKKASDDKWTRIWNEKYAEQEKRYYSTDPFTRLTEYSPQRSSLDIDWPIEDLDMSPVSERPSFEYLKDASGRFQGRRKKVASSRV